MAKYTAKQIAQWFINKSAIEAESGRGDPIGNMKLQKLLYYAQGASLALKGKKLFEDKILAWEHGPVVYDVWSEYRGQTAITSRKDLKIDKETNDLLELVYETFGQYSAWKLREMTHKESPWILTEQSKEIKPTLIEKYFRENYVQK